MVLEAEGGVYDRQECARAFGSAFVGILRVSYPREWIGSWWAALMQHGGHQGYLSGAQRRGIEGRQGGGNPEVA